MFQKALLLGNCLYAAAIDSQSQAIVGDVRVQALSPTLLRVEPKGPHGFEDRTTFMVTSRDFAGVAFLKQSTTAEGTTLSSKYYDVLLRNTSQPCRTCSAHQSNGDANAPGRSKKYPRGARAWSADECCQLCQGDASCFFYVYQPSARYCFPLSWSGGSHAASDRVFGTVSRRPGASFRVTSPEGQVLYDTNDDKDLPNLLHWPAPLTQSSYSLMDHPRFFVPEWGTAPMPPDAKIDPALKPTNGYDFTNDVEGDSYVFLLGSDLSSWSRSRAEFLQLAGSCPLLPNFAYGTWFTYWYSYTESEAKDDIGHWESLKLPIDVWALDMNWRNTSNHQDWFYNHPNTQLFPNFTEWFQYLREHNLRTYFNDHPYPVQDRAAGGGQTSPEEVAFRWHGLSEWMEKGLTFWWFDHNWGISIPPPFVDNGGHTDGVWEGLDNAAWGSHVYYNAVRYFDETVRDKQGDSFYGGHPITLTKFGKPDWRPGMDPIGHAESPAQHRYPVWWTGDGVSLQASVESMVDAGLYDFKPFVHSDCGGDYKGSAGDLMRWTAHCAYGSILRFHGEDHRCWKYGDATVDTVRSYLNARYRLLPSIISAGHRATETGFPLAARGDFYWPEHSESSTNLQYLFLDDILVAPIFDSKKNETSRSVWIPPGEWEDAWDGSIVTGPQTITATQPYERQPMWHKHDGGLLVLADQPAMRVDDQDWSSLVLEAFPSLTAQESRRTLHERGSVARTDIVLTTDGRGGMQVHIGSSPLERQWTLRVHLRKGEQVVAASIDGVKLQDPSAQLRPDNSVGYFPLGGVGMLPPPKAGPVAEFQIPKHSQSHAVTIFIQAEPEISNLAV